MHKKIVLFGCGHVAEKNFFLDPAFIVDNNPDLIGNTYQGFEVQSPEVLKGRVSEFQVVVCTTSITEVKKQLINLGFVWGEDAKVASLLSERMEMSKLEDIKFRFLISSGLPSSERTFSKGGIYLIEEGEDYPFYKHIHAGNTHGLIKYDKQFVFTSQGEGILFLDQKFELVDRIELKNALRPHGVRKYQDTWVLVSSYQDALIGVDDKGNEVFHYPLSHKKAMWGSPQHHCNDVEIVGDFAYISMFSLSGNYKRNSFDGGILEVNLKTGDQTVIISGLTMPHSICCGNAGFRVLDSFKGNLLGNNFSVLATLPGFVRGLDESDDYYFIGESKNRNFSRLNPGRSPVSIDSRITIVHKEYSFARSLQLPKHLSEIHALLRI